MSGNHIPARKCRSTLQLLAFLIALTMSHPGFGEQLKPSGHAPAGATSGTSSGSLTQPSPRSSQDDAARIEEFEQWARDGHLGGLERRLKSYIDQHKTSSNAYYLLGYVYYHHQMFEDSAKALSRSIELDDQNARSHILLGRALTKLDQCDKAQRALERAIQIEPNSAEAHYYLGRSLSAQEDYAKAREEFEQAIKINPGYAEAYNALGFALESMGEDTKAHANYEKAIEISRKRQKPFEAPYVNMSSYYNLRGDAARGMEYAKRALAINPRSDLAYFQLGRAYRALENWPEAAGALEHAIALMPSAPQYQYALSGVYRKLGKMPESQAALAKFRKLEKSNADHQARRHNMRGRPMGLQRSEGAYERD
ncbi:MAG: tetratricopeptide repeat protein [Acidobacteria bacterium]|nr:tetratricopeptide repeat protein [Acidobacteriota bacterium]